MEEAVDDASNAFLNLLGIEEIRSEFSEEINIFVATLILNQDQNLDYYLCFFLHKIIKDGLKWKNRKTDKFSNNFHESFIQPEASFGDFSNFITLVSGVNILLLGEEDENQAFSLNEEIMENGPWLVVRRGEEDPPNLEIVEPLAVLSNTKREKYLKDADVLVIERDLSAHIRTLKKFLLENTKSTNFTKLFKFNGSSYEKVLNEAKSYIDGTALYYALEIDAIEENIREDYEEEALEEFESIVAFRMLAVFDRIQYLIDHVDD